MSSPTGNREYRGSEPVGRAALIASVGGQRGWADWANPQHRLRRLLAEFIGMAGLTFVLSGGAAILVRYGGNPLQPWQTVLVLSLVSALWLVVAVYFLGDISAHFNPAMTLAFALRLPRGDLPGPAQLGTEGLPHPHLLQRSRQRRSLRRVGRARTVRNRNPGSVQVVALTRILDEHVSP
jgi:hypothetical protein